MTRFSELLGTDFDGEPTTDIEDVLYGAFDEPAHRDRVPGLVELMNAPAAPEVERFLACVALTTWGEAAGYEAVLRAAADPEATPWYDFSIDRKFSVDSTFAQLADAVAERDLAEEKGTEALRVEAARALVRLADSQYFEDKLGELFDNATLLALLDDIKEVVGRGVRFLATDEKRRFDLPTQLVDLASGVATVDGALGVELAMSVLNAGIYTRTLNHAVPIVHRAKGPEARQFGEYLMTVGDEDVQRQVREILNQA
ncbi:hypothetical protein [Streptomyces hesseae]|uniref:HEAT repeat domain-containing protein n=1 Tax=Streptomyces hesseae TaxID=3075519 RepID=A0ABU2SYH4_9ACTN|nr:hypothetical protein [Streptomyces sp. DSM 40473]MDT0453907.1 hypothetical protein [Streptomyces sp. DSM 40473]